MSMAELSRMAAGSEMNVIEKDEEGFSFWPGMPGHSGIIKKRYYITRIFGILSLDRLTILHYSGYFK